MDREELHMLIDLTVEVTPKAAADAQGNEKKALAGHLGTHFDVMDREFPLEYVKRKGLVFDVSQVSGRDIESGPGGGGNVCGIFYRISGADRIWNPGLL